MGAPGTVAGAAAASGVAGAATPLTDRHRPPGVPGRPLGAPSGRTQRSGPPLRDPSGSGGPPVRVPRLTEKMRPAGWFGWVVTILVVGIVAAVTYVQIRGADDGAGGAITQTGDVSSGLGSEQSDDGGDEGGPGADLLWQDDISESTYGAPATDGALGYVPDETGRVTAFDIASGEQAWQVKVGDVGGSLALLAGGHLIVTTSEPTALLALDPATGATVWTAPDVYISSPPAVVGDLLISSAGLGISAVNLTNGAVAWETDFELTYLFDGEMLASPAGDIVVGSVSTDNMLVGVRVDGSGVAWTRELPRRTASLNDMAAVGDAVVAADDDGFVNVVAFADGAVRHSLDVAAGTFAEPAAVGTDAAVYLESNELLIFDPATGQERARIADGSTTFTPLPGEAPALLVSAYDSLRAVTVDGQELWRAPAPFVGSELSAAGDSAMVVDSEGLVAAYRLPA